MVTSSVRVGAHAVEYFRQQCGQLAKLHGADVAHQCPGHTLGVGIQRTQEIQTFRRNAYLDDTSVRLAAFPCDESTRTQLVDQSSDIWVAGDCTGPDLPAGQGGRVAAPEDAQHIEQTGGQVELRLQELLPWREEAGRRSTNREQRFLFRGGERASLLDLLREALSHGRDNSRSNDYCQEDILT